MGNPIQIFKTRISEDCVERVTKVLRSGYIGEGPMVKEFEDSMAKLGMSYPLGLNSATSALHLAVVLCGVKPGDEVITTAQTFMATSHVILAQGAKPVYADVKYEDGNIDPADIEHRITKKTKAIMIVHWAGYPCDLDEIHAIAARHNLPVIEDGAHALGAEYKGKPIGSLSRFTCFSFQAIKHLTTGDGGMLCCTLEDDYHAARRQRWFGIDRLNRKPSALGEPEWNVTELGFKYHMNDIAAAIGLGNLPSLPMILARRTEIAGIYRKDLGQVSGLKLFESKSDRKHANWLFCLHVEKRLAFIEMMAKKGIVASVVHLRIDQNDVFGGMRHDLPNLARLTEDLVCIPVHDQLTDAEVRHIVQSVKGGW